VKGKSIWIIIKKKARRRKKDSEEKRKIGRVYRNKGIKEKEEKAK